MVDRVKMLKYETPEEGTQNNRRWPTEIDPNEDYAVMKGVSFNGSVDHLIDTDSEGNIRFLDDNNNILLNDITQSLASKLTKGTYSIFCLDNGQFTTLQGAIDSASYGSVIFVGPKSGSWGDIELKAGVSIVGLQPPRGRDVVVGQIRFAPTTGSASSNDISVANLRTQISNNGKKALLVEGSAAYRLRFSGMWFYTQDGVTDEVVSINNTTAGSSCYIQYSRIQYNASATNTGNLINSNCPFLKTEAVDFSGGNIPINITGGLFEGVRARIEANTTNKLVSLSGNSAAVFGASFFRNLATNANGIEVASGSTLSIGGSSIFDISAGSGYCVKGAGVYLYDNTVVFAHIAVFNPRNVKLQNTLTIAQYTNTPSVEA
jgi:hypothetical protein